MKPRLDIDKKAPVAVTLFSGGGGVECGLIEAGIRPVCAVEFDPTKPELSASLADMHDRNFKEYGCKLIRRSVQDVARLNFPGIPRTPDFLHASPVCSNFSPAKTGGEETQVDIDCAEAVAKAITVLQPKVFTLEQVPRYQKSRSWEIIKSQLDVDGYQTAIAVCNMADWGLPQARVRIVVLACKDFLPELPPKQDRISWYEAIADLIPSMPDSNLVKAQLPLAKGKNPLFIHRTCEIRAVPSDRCANTIRRSFFTDQNGNNRNRFADIWLPDGTVKQVTIPAIARLQGFPEWYELDPCLSVSGQMLGYSVPPLFASQLFLSLMAQLIQLQTPTMEHQQTEPVESTCGLQISFGWTAQYLPAKTVTRRDWKDSHAQKFIKAYERGDRVAALDKDKRYGGKQIGWCKLACLPYKEKLSDMPISDVSAEGGMVSTTKEFIDKYFDGDSSKEVWVIRFAFLPGETPTVRITRHELDRYDSPHWFVTAIAPYVDLHGTVGECCVGGGILAKSLNLMGCDTWTNDINFEVHADYHVDATIADNWANFPKTDWVFTNPPYGAEATQILINAYNHAKRGIVMLLRTTWDEPCEDRGDWLYDFSYTRKITLPRFKFRKDKDGKRWATDNCTIAAYIWDKKIPCQPSISLPASKIQLFHDNPENGPSWETIEFTFKPAMEVEIEPQKCPMGDAHTGYLYQRKKGDRLIWEYRYCNQNYYVAVGKFGRVKTGIVNGLSGDRILATVFRVKESVPNQVVDVNSLCQ
ncbi:MAG: DNA cytosine methyltransferase [Cyanomargarita calcarea GSE-NOS-MK-12-04C]|jgi:DNA (cytosine-5)-methyltransferase 1|uniref:DNA (cytosine-5-)-methyltransferase n=1 Tax=Cyanomargarita calcarea GSE-NOS-MK-12-04C TaxID=2839659 RepID=A0A951QIY6_9CYAN|nr:DNA cytosine methyltransferase [Cyanomargarita calcarea GSE-NOS-MK-12-04C]